HSDTDSPLLPQPLNIISTLSNMERIKQQIRDLTKSDPAAAARKINQYLEQIDDIQLNIGITGETGSGKSSFVNAFRGIKNKDKEAAPVGVKETSKAVGPYFHPNYPNVILWDLPGIGSTTWPTDEYVNKIKFDTFDFFIIASDTLFRENDMKLAKEIQKMGKRFYFVRTKIDQTLTNEEENEGNFNAERTLAVIRKRCIQGLQEQGFEDPPVFLLSNNEWQQHDFPRLHETFRRELFDLKKYALLCVMAAIHLEVTNNKKETYKAEIKYYGAVSALGAAVPIPGLSVAFDIGMIVKAVKEYVTGFGLHASSLHRLATSTGVPYDDLSFSIQSVLAKGEVTGDVILKLLTQLGSTSVLLATEEWTRYIPFLGIPIASALSFTATHRALNFFLDELASEANKVYRQALGSDNV
uniref:IRG-type G domain-containing protein n=1 Tax=Poecilia latipinna TaxID=48699 RepID=A0A3B3W326_9TELE